MTFPAAFHSIAGRAGILFVAVAAFTTPVLAQSRVKPPPLPPGSSMVRIEGGMNPQEASRQVRAHTNKLGHPLDHGRQERMRPHQSHPADAAPAAAVLVAPPGGAPVVNAHFGDDQRPPDARPRPRAKRDSKTPQAKPGSSPSNPTQPRSKP